MKYFVYKTGYFYSIGILILLYASLASIIVISIIFVAADNHTSLLLLLIYSTLIVLFSIFPLYSLMLQGSLIFFEDNVIKCVFFKRIRRIIAYSEINDYGTFWRGREKFIYISRFKLNEIQRNTETYILYRKTKDVLVLQHHDEIMKLMKVKCHSIHETT